jgi:hypothetical protein
MAVAAGERIALPERVVAAARHGIRRAPCTITDRLWAYEIEQAARELLELGGLADQIAVRTNGETVCFTPAD